MQYKTLKNMENAVSLIMAKGYDQETANDIAIKCFDNHAACKNGMPVEWFIDKVAFASEF